MNIKTLKTSFDNLKYFNDGVVEQIIELIAKNPRLRSKINSVRYDEAGGISSEFCAVTETATQELVYALLEDDILSSGITYTKFRNQLILAMLHGFLVWDAEIPDFDEDLDEAWGFQDLLNNTYRVYFAYHAMGKVDYLAKRIQLPRNIEDFDSCYFDKYFDQGNVFLTAGLCVLIAVSQTPASTLRK